MKHDHELLALKNTAVVGGNDPVRHTIMSFVKACYTPFRLSSDDIL